MKDCPKCRLTNPDGALHCDCGYDFGSGTMQKSYLSEKGFRKGGNAFLVVAAVLAILKAMEYVSSDRWMAGAMIAVVALICVVTLVGRYHTA